MTFMPPPDPRADEATDVLVEHADQRVETRSPRGTTRTVTRVWNVFAQDDLVAVFPDEEAAVRFAVKYAAAHQLPAWFRAGADTPWVPLGT